MLSINCDSCRAVYFKTGRSVHQKAVQSVVRSSVPPHVARQRLSPGPEVVGPNTRIAPLKHDGKLDVSLIPDADLNSSVSGFMLGSASASIRPTLARGPSGPGPPHVFVIIGYHDRARVAYCLPPGAMPSYTTVLMLAMRSTTTRNSTTSVLPSSGCGGLGRRTPSCKSVLHSASPNSSDGGGG